MDEDSYAACVGGWANIWSSATFDMLQHVARGTTKVESAVSARERMVLSFETVRGLRRMRAVRRECVARGREKRRKYRNKGYIWRIQRRARRKLSNLATTNTVVSDEYSNTVTSCSGLLLQQT